MFFNQKTVKSHKSSNYKLQCCFVYIKAFVTIIPRACAEVFAPQQFPCMRDGNVSLYLDNTLIHASGIL